MKRYPLLTYQLDHLTRNNGIPIIFDISELDILHNALVIKDGSSAAQMVWITIRTQSEDYDMSRMCVCGHVKKEHYQYIRNGKKAWCCKGCDPISKLGPGNFGFEHGSYAAAMLDASHHEFKEVTNGNTASDNEASTEL